ncbi:uncharacterized protein LOC105693156 [Athalia rosae]|uniref:uncharacterized protein LOC105693156 n=1 Tax=Athalia rosae TaxID=37344 RepID=UPI0020340013|nr:uncharacterized protein LOC105693156 [Athalia rosae]XP_048505904.1 uncharacterized protein LOC105693156 [Athalia rosae]
MTNLEGYQLLHPELLTEETLLEILKDRCIEVPKLKSKSKTEMVEIFKRVALPLPQRKCSTGTPVRKRSLGLPNGRDAQEATSMRIAKMSLDTSPTHSSNESLSTTNSSKSRIIRLSKSSPTTETSPDTNKRKSEKNSSEPVHSHKRQKITWP